VRGNNVADNGKSQYVNTQHRCRLQELLRTSALSYAAAGWPIFPVAENRNAPPCIERWQERATTEPATICEWWSRWPRANIGLYCGDRLFVLDVDPRHDGKGSLDKLIAGHGPLPRTVVSITPGGGWHVYFRGTRPRISISAGRLGPGLDVRTSRGYIVLPPSIRRDGAYRWAKGRGPDDVGMASTPEWLLDLAEPSPPPPPEDRRPIIAPTDRLARFALDKEVEAVQTAANGLRNQTLYVASRKLGRLAADGLLDWSDIKDALVDAALLAGLSKGEATTTVRSALRSRGGPSCRS
jgi:bifunctional DNA primase/polymerase-like protein